MDNCLKHIKKTNEIIFTVFSLHIKTLYQKTNKSISYSFFSLYIKTTNKYYQENKEKLRKKAHERYQRHKERLGKEARKKYQNLSKEEKDQEKVQGKKKRSKKYIKIFLRNKSISYLSI